MKYYLKKSELMRAGFYMTLYQYRERKYGKLCLFLLLTVFVLSLPAGLITGNWLFFELTAAVVLLWCLLYIRAVRCIYSSGKRQGALEAMEVFLEDGTLKISGRTYTEWPAGQILRVLRKGSLLLIMHRRATGQEVYLIVPARAFAGEAQMEAFLRRLAEASARKEDTARSVQEEPLYRFSFFMDQGLFLRGLLMTDQKLANRRRPRTRRIQKMAKQDRFLKVLGEWTVTFYRDCITIVNGETEDYIDWKSCQGILESPDMYVFYGEKYGNLFAIPRQAVPAEFRDEFQELCHQKTLWGQYAQGRFRERRLSGAVRALLLIMILLVLVIGGVLGILIRGENTGNHTREEPDWEYDPGFIFRPDDYPDYRSIEDQIEVLKGLGFDVPDGALDYYHDWIDDSEYGRLHVEGYPYYTLLSDLGTPNYDLNTYQFLGYSDQVYWFACDSWDISRAYMEILEGVQALIGEESVFIGMKEDCEAVNWNKGTGNIRVTFWCNGHPHEFEARVDGDWLDMDFISFLNDVLEQEGFENHLYSCTDNDQGCILFYRDEVWAEEFMEKTGLELSIIASDLY